MYLFGGTGDENESYSATNPPFESSDIWNGWVLFTDFNGNIIKSDVFCHEEVNTATEYGDLTENGYVIFNDTDAFGDTEVGVMKIINPSLTNSSHNVLNSSVFFPNPTSSILSFEAPIKNEKFAKDFCSPNRNFFFNKSCVNVCGEVLGISIKEVIPPATAALLSE